MLNGKLISFLMTSAICTPTIAALGSNLGSDRAMIGASRDFPIRKVSVDVPSVNTNFEYA